MLQPQPRRLPYDIRMRVNIFSREWWWTLLHGSRLVHFFAVGMKGVALNLCITALLTELFFGRENYFSAYLIGLSANLLYNFLLHTFVTFKTRSRHAVRLIAFVAYSLGLAYLQAQLVRYLTNLIGVDWYLVVISSVILTFSFGTFIVFKLLLFKERGRGGEDAVAEV